MSGGERVRVLDVGQCAADHAAIRALLERHFDVEIERAGTAAEACEAARCGRYALVLVNRILDATGESGVEVIRSLEPEIRAGRVRTMLVSNYPEAQEEAVAAGALRGFGKAALHDRETVSRLAAVLPLRAATPR